MADGGHYERSRSRSRERGGWNEGRNTDSREERPSTAEKNPGTNLYVTNLSFKTTDDSLRAAFSHFGEVLNAAVVKEPVTHESRGFGFVAFAHIEDAERAISALNGNDVDGRTVKVEKSKRAGGYEKTPGQYLGPRQMSSKYGERGGRGRGGSDSRGYDRPSGGYGGGGYGRDERDFDRGGGSGYDSRGGYRDRPPVAMRDDRYAARGGASEYAPSYSAAPHGGGYGGRDEGRYAESHSGRYDAAYDRRSDAYSGAPPVASSGYGSGAGDYAPRRDYDDRRPPPRDDSRRGAYDSRAPPPTSGGYGSAPTGGYGSGRY